MHLMSRPLPPRSNHLAHAVSHLACAHDLPTGEVVAFSAPLPFGCAHDQQHQQQHRQGTAERRASPDQGPRDRGRRGHLRPARRRHPPGVRPDHRLADPPHPRAPRAGRRPHGRGLRPRHRPPRRGHGDERPGGHQHRHARCATPTWTRSRWSSSPARCPTAAIGTDAFQECDTTGITQSVTKHNFLVTDGRRTSPGRSARRSTSPPPAGPGPVLVDIPKDIVDPQQPQLGDGVVLARRRVRPARLQARPPRATPR